MKTGFTRSSFLAASLKGTTVGQVALQRGIAFDDLMKRDQAELTSIVSELDALGLDYNQLSEAHSQALLMFHFINEDNRDFLITHIAHILWTDLGDPISNGEKPPELYVEAARRMAVVFGAIIAPESMKHIMDSIQS